MQCPITFQLQTCYQKLLKIPLPSKVPPDSPELIFADCLDDDVVFFNISNASELLDTTGNLGHVSAATDLLLMQKKVKIKKELIKKSKSKEFQELELFCICKEFIQVSSFLLLLYSTTISRFILPLLTSFCCHVLPPLIDLSCHC